MATTPRNFTLHIPRMWVNVVRTFNPDFYQHVNREIIPVSETGINDSVYRSLPADRADHLNVMMLPVAHCALNMDEFDLEIIGPAVATRNDIFVFRAKEKPAPKDGLYIVGTKEVDITSSNIFRIVMTNWPDDMLFYVESTLSEPDLKESISKIKGCLLGKLKCEAENRPDVRLKRLLNGQYHAAVFMGEELSVRREGAKRKKSLFQMEDVIDVLNLNRRINSLYHVRSLPRAVLCVRRSSVVDRVLIDQFVAMYNGAVKGSFPKTIRGGEGRQQLPLMIGPGAKEQEIEALIRFTKDMHSLPVKNWRRRDISTTRAEELGVSRELKRRDFTHWNITYRSKYEDAIAGGMRKLWATLPHDTRLDGPTDNLPPGFMAWLHGLPELPKDPALFATKMHGAIRSPYFEPAQLASVTESAAVSVDKA